MKMGNTMLPLHKSQQARLQSPARNPLEAHQVSLFPDMQVEADIHLDITERDIMELVVLDLLGQFPKRIPTAPSRLEAHEQLVIQLPRSPRLSTLFLR